MKLVTPAESITHLHLLNAVASQITEREPAHHGPVRILDAGCGNGHLASYLHKNLAAIFPGREIEIHGYDVANHAVQSRDFFARTVDWCQSSCPEVPWQARLKLISQDEPWPFEAGFFDIVVSNQVLEHVRDHRQFFGEHFRVLKQGGSGVHLFPLKHYIYEGHLLLPFVHRIADWHMLKWYITVLSSIGLGKYRSAKPISLAAYAEKHADYMSFLTNYLGYSELMSLVRQSGLRPSLSYTPHFYLHKLRDLLGKRSTHLKPYRSGRSYWFLNHLLKYVSCITLLAARENVYSND